MPRKKSELINHYSLHPLHLHIISEDLDSEHMKHPRHWQDFTTAQAIPLDVIIQRLEKGLPAREFEAEYYEKVKKGPTRCHRCHAQMPVKNLKVHILGPCTSSSRAAP